MMCQINTLSSSTKGGNIRTVCITYSGIFLWEEIPLSISSLGDPCNIDIKRKRFSYKK